MYGSHGESCEATTFGGFSLSPTPRHSAKVCHRTALCVGKREERWEYRAQAPAVRQFSLQLEGKMVKSLMPWAGRSVQPERRSIHIWSTRTLPWVSEIRGRPCWKRKQPSKSNSWKYLFVIIVNETYLTVYGNDCQGTGYFTSPRKVGSSYVKYIPHIKFPKKVGCGNQ